MTVFTAQYFLYTAYFIWVITWQMNTIYWDEIVSTEELLHYLWRKLHTHSLTHWLTAGSVMLLLHVSRPDCCMAATLADACWVHVEPRFRSFFPHRPYIAFPHPHFARALLYCCPYSIILVMLSLVSNTVWTSSASTKLPDWGVSSRVSHSGNLTFEFWPWEQLLWSRLS
jgi:hypothetical protein